MTTTLAPLDLFVAILIDREWTITQHPVTGKGLATALRASNPSDGSDLIVYFSGHKPYGYELVGNGSIERVGNVPWLTERIVAAIKGLDTVEVAVQFALVIDGEPMGYFETPTEIGNAVIDAYAHGAIKVEILRATN